MNALLPNSWSQALALKAQHPDAVPIAGGTDLLVSWPEELARQEQTFLDLSGAGDQRALSWLDHELRIGALATYWDVLCDSRAGVVFPLLHLAAREVGAIQIQSRGTWAGNIANASPAADGVPVLMAYDAVVELASQRSQRLVPLCDFFRGYKKLDMRPDELIAGIRIPIRSYSHQHFIKVGARSAQAISKTGVAIACSESAAFREPPRGAASGRAVREAGWRIVAISMNPTTCRCRAIEQMLTDQTPMSSPRDLLDAVQRDLSPIDDIRSTADYRREVFCNVVYHALPSECAWIT